LERQNHEQRIWVGTTFEIGSYELPNQQVDRLDESVAFGVLWKYFTVCMAVDRGMGVVKAWEPVFQDMCHLVAFMAVAQPRL
jgi:hypothetical protein